MKFIFTGQQQSLLDFPPHLSSFLKCHRQLRGWSKLGALAVVLLLPVFFPYCAQRTAGGEMGMQSEAAQSVSRNTARAARLLSRVVAL